MSLACSDVSGYVASQCFVSVALKSTHADHAEPVWLTEKLLVFRVTPADGGDQFFLAGLGDSAVAAHYLASRSVGGWQLGLTTVASIFSGYTVTGMPAEAYRTGQVIDLASDSDSDGDGDAPLDVS